MLIHLTFRHFLRLMSMCIFFCIHTVQAQFTDALPRHAFWGASFDDPTDTRAGALVRSVRDSSFAASVGLKPNDILLKVNNYTFFTNAVFQECRTRVRGGDKVEMLVNRQGNLITLSGVVPPMPKESFPGVVSEYKSVLTAYGYKVQVIITRPQNTTGKIPAVFVVRWLSCDPIEKPVSPVNRKHGVARLLEDLVAKSGYAVIRVEKTGLGDSEGPSCDEADFRHELAAHKAAFEAFKQLDYVDTTKIFMFGQSNGGAYAPLVVDNFKPAGYFVSGVWLKTWYEHMLEFERRKMELQKITPAEVTRKMVLVSEFYTDYLIKEQLPGTILKAKPYLKEIWDDGDAYQYGITVSYFQQLQDLNVAEAWANVSVPVYCVYGSNDFLMSKDDHEKLITLVNKNSSGLGVFEEVAGMEHSMFWFDNRQNAFDDFYGKGVYKNLLFFKIKDWMELVLRNK